MTTNEAIEYLNRCADGLDTDFDRAVSMAILALQHQQQAEKNDPLTLEELREMDGDKIYIQHIGHCKGFYEDVYAPYFGRHEQYVHGYNDMIGATDLPLKYYGTEWMAYRHKPDEGT